MNDKLPALFLVSSMSIGGSEKKVVRIANALHQRGHVVHVAYLGGPTTLLPELTPSIPICCLERTGKFSLSALVRLRSYIRAHNIAQVFCVNLYPLLYVVPIAKLDGTCKLSCVALVNSTDFLSAKEKWSMALFAPLLRRIDRVIFGCAFQMSQWIKRYHLQPDKCGYIYNGVDTTFYSPESLGKSRDQIRASMGFVNDDLVLGTVGSLRAEKGHQYLIEAAALLRDGETRMRTIIVGEGKERKSLEHLIQERGLGNSVWLLGEISDVRPVLLAMDIFVLPSTSETFSNAALEAMAMGRPVIISDITGAREMVWDGVNGYLFPKGDVNALAAILNRLNHNRILIKVLGDKAQAMMDEKFSFQKMVDHYETLLPIA